MAKLTEEQLIQALVNVTEKEAHLLAIQTVELLQAVRQREFSVALTLYEPLQERVQFLRGMLLRALNTSTRPN